MLVLPGVGREIHRSLWALRAVISKLKKYVFVVWGKTTFSLFLLKTKVRAGRGAGSSVVHWPPRCPGTRPGASLQLEKNKTASSLGSAEQG